VAGEDGMLHSLLPGAASRGIPWHPTRPSPLAAINDEVQNRTYVRGRFAIERIAMTEVYP